MKTFKFKCSNGDGTYSYGYIEKNKVSEAKDDLEKIYHSVSYIQLIK